MGQVDTRRYNGHSCPFGETCQVASEQCVKNCRHGSKDGKYEEKYSNPNKYNYIVSCFHPDNPTNI